MFSSLRPRQIRPLAWPLPALILVASCPGRAQSSASAPQTKPAPNAPAPAQSSAPAPQLTLESRPASTIATARRPASVRVRDARGLVLALPAPIAASPTANAGASQKSGGKPGGSAGFKANADAMNPGVPVGALVPDTLMSSAKGAKVTAKTRFPRSRVPGQSDKNVGLQPPTAPLTTAQPATSASTTASTSATASTSTTASTSATASTGVPAAPLAASSQGEASRTSARDGMSRLPSRGGMRPNRAPVELHPIPPETKPISESQRRLLAELDADLGRAQRRLNRAETRLTEGQRQLGAFTGVLQTAMLDAGDDARGLHPFVRVAQRYAGTPYVWGGESARGFDCSGFIMRVMRDLGYRALPHSAAEQFNYGLPVAKALLKPGDIVFFANTYKPGVSHVGIYLGRGRFIHAANSKVGTIVSGINDPKWVQHYAGARRLLPVKS